VVGTTQHELPVGRTPIRVILVMEIRSGCVRLVGMKMKDFEGRSLKKRKNSVYNCGDRCSIKAFISFFSVAILTFISGLTIIIQAAFLQPAER